MRMQKKLMPQKSSGGKEPTQANPQWAKQNKGTYDFDVTKVDKLFELLLKEGRIKLQPDHPMLRGGVKDKKYCGFHNSNSHSINDCRVFRLRIQRAIEVGHLKFIGKMKVDHDPFPSQNMVSGGFPKNKVKVLTSERAKGKGVVDSEVEISMEEFQKKPFKNSQTEEGESSNPQKTKPRVTSSILLNKWQRQQENEYYQHARFVQERRRYEEERYAR